MEMNEIRTIAKGRISPGRMTKQDLIQAIQLKEGNFPCFQAAVEFCEQFECCWRNDFQQKLITH